MSRLSSCDIPEGEVRDRHAHLCSMLRHARAEQARIERMMRSMINEMAWLQQLWDQGARPIRAWELELARIEGRYRVCKPHGERRAPPRTPSHTEQSLGFDEARRIRDAINRLTPDQRDAIMRVFLGKEGGTED